MSAWDFLLVAALAGCCFFNVVSQSTEQKVFSCDGRPNGYYADVSSGCQIYHMCDGLGRQFSYSCPNTTLFQQRMLICDHWYMVNCSKAELDYGANLLIGQRGKPFVEDDGENPYHRTPRPDLLVHPSAAEFNIIYRTGRAQGTSSKNLVGADKYEVPKDANTPAYFLPSHWSTEYSRNPTEKAVFEKNVKVKGSKGDFKKNHFVKGDDGNFRREESHNSGNFKKGEVNLGKKEIPTPNFNKKDVPLGSLNKKESLPQVNLKKDNINSHVKDFHKNETPFRTNIAPPANFERREPFPRKESEVHVNFHSNFKATTPVYPKIAPTEVPVIENDFQPAQLSKLLLPPIVVNRGGDTKVNFPSNFKATTPVYPKIAPPEATESFIPEKINAQLAPPKKQDVGIFSVHEIDFNRESENVFLKPTINFASSYKATTPVYPESVTPETPLASEEVPPANAPKTYGLSSIIEPPKLPNQKIDFFQPVKVNFRSDFKATTPVYPKFVTPETPLAIQDASIDPNKPVPSTVVQPPKGYTENELNLLKEPSIYYQPPLLVSSKPRSTASSESQIVDNFKKNSDDFNRNQQLKELRKLFLIPDYEFPLDSTAVRPGYDQGPDSFQVNPFSYDLTPRKHA